MAIDGDPVKRVRVEPNQQPGRIVNTVILQIPQYLLNESELETHRKCLIEVSEKKSFRK
jgi:hypothetical protein